MFLILIRTQKSTPSRSSENLTSYVLFLLSKFFNFSVSKFLRITDPRFTPSLLPPHFSPQKFAQFFHSSFQLIVFIFCFSGHLVSFYVKFLHFVSKFSWPSQFRLVARKVPLFAHSLFGTILVSNSFRQLGLRFRNSFFKIVFPRLTTPTYDFAAWPSSSC